MKEVIGTISSYPIRKGHTKHVAGTGAHVNKKKYNRKVKHTARLH